MPLILLLLLLLLAPPLQAGPPPGAPLASGAEPSISYLRTTSGQMAESVLNRGGWHELGKVSPNLGYQGDATLWFRFDLSNLGQDQITKIVEVRYPNLDRINFRLYEDGSPIQSYMAGDQVPFHQRPIDHPQFLFPITLEADRNYEVLLEVQTRGSMLVPVRVWDTLDLFESIGAADQAHALYFGILIVIVLFNLFVFLTLREITYLYYSLCTFSFLFLTATLMGVTYPLFWPEIPWLQNQAMLVSVPFATIFASLFVRSFLQLRTRNLLMDKIFLAILGAAVLAMAGAFVLDYNTSIRASVALAIPACLMAMLMGPLEWWRGNQAARLYTLAWGLLTIGCAVAALNKYGWLPTVPITEYSIQISSSMEAILLTIALAQRLFREREDKIEAQDAQLREHSDRRLAEVKLMEQAFHHPTTGLPNRASYELRARELFRSQPERRYTIGVIQLIDYSTVHKTLGHTNTDRVVAEAARRFNCIAAGLPGIQCIERAERVSFYLGALEMSVFAFILDAEVAERENEALAQSLAKLKEPIFYLGMELSLTPATGLAVFPDHGKDINNLIRQAYIAQEHPGGSDLAYYISARDLYSADRLTMAAELKKALLEDRLTLYFQPKLSLESHRVVGLEALIRWPRRGKEVSPETLVAVAEQTGLIKPLTRWVLEQALEARSQFVAAGFDLSIAVNVSPNNLREPDFPEFVQRLMTKHKNHLGYIGLELTETSMMLDPGNSLRVLRSLVRAGIPISIDDFGSGYSSLSYIKRLPVREIKIDRSLITDLCEQADDRVIVQTTITMCHNLGYRVVAEGVEDRATQMLLERMGCDQVQGFVLTEPLAFADTVAWLAEAESQTRIQLA